MPTKFSFNTLVLTLLFCSHALANDTMVRVSAGGLTFIKNEDIRMKQEILMISKEKIRVQYRFINESKQDIKSTVAFPMPLYTWVSGESFNEGPITSFKVWTNGEPIKTKSMRKAMIGDRDITPELRKVGLSDHQIFVSFGQDNEKPFTKRQNARITELSGISADQPRWEIQETAYWEQNFPTGREIAVEHSYKPFLGGVYTVGAIAEMPTYADWVKPKREENEACLDEGIKKTIEARAKKILSNGAPAVRVNLHDVEYILGTGRNWKGPISDFKLRIEKSSADEIVSLCFPGKPKKISPLILEFSQSNYLPQDKLIIHFYQVTPEVD
jgi:hypothetical protein